MATVAGVTVTLRTCGARLLAGPRGSPAAQADAIQAADIRPRRPRPVMRRSPSGTWPDQYEGSKTGGRASAVAQGARPTVHLEHGDGAALGVPHIEEAAVEIEEEPLGTGPGRDAEELCHGPAG